MAILYNTVGTNAKATSGDVIPGLPSGFFVGDMHICTIVAKDNINCTMPVGWIPIDAGTNNGTGLRTTCFYKLAEAGDTNPTVTHTGGSYIVADIVGYTGVDVNNPIDVIGTTKVNSASTTVTANAITTTQNNATVIFIGGSSAQCQFSNYSGSPTPTERFDRPNTLSYPSQFLSSFLLANAGSTSSRTCTATSSAVNNGLLFSLKQVIVPDFSGNNLHGYLNGASTTTGKIGDAYNFNGTWNFIEIPYTSTLSPTSAITLSCWAYKTDWTLPASDQGIISKTETGGYGLGVDNSGPNEFYWAIRRNGAYGEGISSTIGLTGGWHHIVGTYDGRYVKIYIDGILKNTNDAGGNYSIQYSNSNSLIIGGESGSSNIPESGYFFTEYIDEVVIWNNAKDQSFITALYNSGNGRIIVPTEETGLLGYWIGESRLTLTGSGGGVSGASEVLINRLNQFYPIGGGICGGIVSIDITRRRFIQTLISISKTNSVVYLDNYIFTEDEQ